jgi:glutamate synthase domain-containing protein 3
MLDQKKVTSEIDAKYLPRVKVENKVLKIDAEELYYRDLNSILRTIVKRSDIERVEIHNVCGQRYIGTDLDTNMQIDVFGTPGNDLGAFMSGPKLVIHGNAQDACGNTMNEGQIVIHGHAGDITGHSMRGGKIFVRDYVGYRVGIHMKEYQQKIPSIVIGQTAGDFLAEYMAGGIILILGLNLKEGEQCKAKFVGTGMHGGVIYERGEILQPEKGTKVTKAGKYDARVIERLVKEFSGYFGISAEEILSAQFKKIAPLSKRPYEKLYSH